MDLTSLLSILLLPEIYGYTSWKNQQFLSNQGKISRVKTLDFKFSIVNNQQKTDNKLTCEQFRSHMDGSPNNTTRHHCFRFAKPQICDFSSVGFIKLQKTQKTSGKLNPQDLPIQFLSHILNNSIIYNIIPVIRI